MREGIGGRRKGDEGGKGGDGGKEEREKGERNRRDGREEGCPSLYTTKNRISAVL